MQPSGSDMRTTLGTQNDALWRGSPRLRGVSPRAPQRFPRARAPVARRTVSVTAR